MSGEENRMGDMLRNGWVLSSGVARTPATLRTAETEIR